MHPREQKEILEQMLEDDCMLLNSGMFEINGKQYELIIEVREYKETKQCKCGYLHHTHGGLKIPKNCRGCGEKL